MKIYRNLLHVFCCPRKLEAIRQKITMKFAKMTKISFRSKSGKALTFGICIPAVCSLDFIQDYLKITNSEKIPLKLLENTCQLEEQASELKTLDWVTM